MGTKGINKTRRNFIKRSVAVGGTILATSAINPFSALIFAAKEPE